MRNDQCTWFGPAVSLPLLLRKSNKAHITAGLVAASPSTTSSPSSTTFTFTSTTSTPIAELKFGTRCRSVCEDVEWAGAQTVVE